MQKNVKHTKPTAPLAVGDDEEVPEFDFSRAQPNRFAARCADGTMRTITTVTGAKKVYVSLDEDVAKKFRSPKSVNDALRLAMQNETKKRVKKVKNNGHNASQ